MSLIRDLQQRFLKRDIVIQLIVVNVAVFVLLNIYMLIINMNDADGSHIWLFGTSDLTVLIKRPWSLITHMFTHEDPFHIFFNMIVLYGMGGVLLSTLGKRAILPVYILGGLIGFLFYLFCYNIIPRYVAQGHSYMLGASAAVMAITLAAAAYAPRMLLNLFGLWRVELRWVAFALVVLDLVNIRRADNTGGHIAHLGGAAFGYFYAIQMLKGKNITAWFEKWIENFKNYFRSDRKMKVHVNHSRPKTDEQFNMEKLARQEQIDRILDKISRAGYDSLSKDEKEFLFKNSQK